MHLRLNFGLVVIFSISIHSPIFSYNPQHLTAVQDYSNRLKATKSDDERRAIVGDFRNFDLSGARLSQLDLSGALFSGANFQNARFFHSDFKNCKMQNANFNNTDLSESNFDNADLEGASFVGASSYFTRLFWMHKLGNWNASFEGANLSNANLTNAWFVYCNFKNSRMMNAVLNNATLDSSNLAGSVLDGSGLQTATLYGVALDGASLVNCGVQQADIIRKSATGKNIAFNVSAHEIIHSPAKVRYLVQAGHGNDAYPQEEGKTLLHCAAEQGNKETVQYLLGNGASINTSSAQGETPLSLAIRSGHEDIARLLLDINFVRRVLSQNANGFDVNELVNGKTPLHIAAQHGQTNIIKLLLERSANKYKRDAQGKLPICESGNNVAVVSLLKDEIVTNKNIKFKDIIGADDVLLKMRNIISLYNRRKFVPGFLLFEGDSGTGKTFLAHAFANETGFSFLEKSAGSFKDMWHGQSEGNVTKEFQIAKDRAPSVFFIDEIDALAAINRQDTGPSASSVDRSTLDILLTSIDSVKEFNANNVTKPVILIGATNLVSNLDAAFRQRSEETVQFRNPSEHGRALIVEHYLKKIEKLLVENNFALKLAQETKGFSVRQLKKLIDAAERYASEHDSDSVTTEHFIRVFGNIYREVHPSIPQQLLRPLFSVPVSKEEAFRDLTGMDDVVDNMNTILDFFRNPEEYIRRDVRVPKAYLLEGPPGTGKTSIAIALARAGGLTFFNYTGAQLLNGGSALVKKSFTDAREMAPSVIFIDEIDSLGVRRTASQDAFSRSVLTEFLSQMEGFEGSHIPVIVVGTTNFASALDDALQTRFKERIQVPLPNQEAREKILSLYLRKKRLTKAELLKERFLKSLASKTENFSGREIESLVEKAALFSVRERSDEINEQHVQRAAQIMAQQLALRHQEGQSSGSVGVVMAGSFGNNA